MRSKPNAPGANIILFAAYLEKTAHKTKSLADQSAGELGEILFFTGVRYEWHTQDGEQSSASSRHPAPHHPAQSHPTRGRRRG